MADNRTRWGWKGRDDGSTYDWKRDGQPATEAEFNAREVEEPARYRIAAGMSDAGRRAAIEAPLLAEIALLEEEAREAVKVVENFQRSLHKALDEIDRLKATAPGIDLELEERALHIYYDYNVPPRKFWHELSPALQLFYRQLAVQRGAAPK